MKKIRGIILITVVASLALVSYTAKQAMLSKVEL